MRKRYLLINLFIFPIITCTLFLNTPDDFIKSPTFNPEKGTTGTAGNSSAATKEALRTYIMSRTAEKAAGGTSTKEYKIADIPTLLIKGTGNIYSFTNETDTEKGSFDLDRGGLAAGRDDDIRFTMHLSVESTPMLHFINGAYGILYGKEEPEVDDCLRIRQAEPYQQPGMNDYVCVTTNKENVAIMKITHIKYNVQSVWEMEFRYSTWKIFV
jgi:hypothetical protein